MTDWQKTRTTFSQTIGGTVSPALPAVQLDSLVQALDAFFGVKLLERDPAFHHRVPAVYENTGFDWQSRFEPDFCRHFNGLMIRGDCEVKRIFCVSFPSAEVLDRILPVADAGDLIFSHHALDMRNGDPRGAHGKGFIPLSNPHLEAMFAKRISVYSCHAPLDYNAKISTSQSMADALEAKVVGSFLPYGNGDAGLFCEIRACSQAELTDRLMRIFRVPYLDVAGQPKDDISRIAIVAGVGGGTTHFAAAEEWGADAYVTGEIAPRIKDDFWDQELPPLLEAGKNSKMALIGVSHAGSEFLVMERDMKPWFETHFGIHVEAIGEEKWWR